MDLYRDVCDFRLVFFPLLHGRICIIWYSSNAHYSFRIDTTYLIYQQDFVCIFHLLRVSIFQLVPSISNRLSRETLTWILFEASSSQIVYKSIQRKTLAFASLTNMDQGSVGAKQSTQMPMWQWGKDFSIFRTLLFSCLGSVNCTPFFRSQAPLWTCLSYFHSLSQGCNNYSLFWTKKN